jgi:RHH-type rel operon transcriptional repressor/antitoxin RelB
VTGTAVILVRLSAKEPTTMLAVRLDPKMERELEQLADATGRSKRFYVKEALAAYLEDRAD